MIEEVPSSLSVSPSQTSSTNHREFTIDYRSGTVVFTLTRKDQSHKVGSPIGVSI